VGIASEADQDAGSRGTVPVLFQIVGWIALIGIAVWAMALVRDADAALRSDLIDQCQAAGRDGCWFEKRERVGRAGDLNGYFPGEGIDGYSRLAPVAKQGVAGLIALVLGNTVLGNPFRR